MESKTLLVDQKIVSYIYNHGESERFFVFLHGRGRTKEDRNGYFQSLQAKKIGFLALDLPGFGKTQAPNGTRGVEEYSEFVLHCIEKLEIKFPVSFVCHSFGGRIGFYLAANYIEKVDKLFLAAPGGVEKIISPFRKKVIKVGKKIFSISALKPLKNKLVQKIGSSDYSGSQILKDTFVKIVNQDLRYLFSNITQQCFLYRGENDDQILRWQIDCMNENIQNIRFNSYPGIGHDVHIDEKEYILNDMINDVSN